jgi:hypothetical protein
VAVKIYIVLILDMTLCSLVGGYQHFTSTLKMEAGDFSETLVTTYRTALCHNTEDYNLNPMFVRF